MVDYSKTEGVGQKIMYSSCEVSHCYETAEKVVHGECMILAAYMLDKAEDEMLDTYLSDKVFAGRRYNDRSR